MRVNPNRLPPDAEFSLLPCSKVFFHTVPHGPLSGLKHRGEQLSTSLGQGFGFVLHRYQSKVPPAYHPRLFLQLSTSWYSSRLILWDKLVAKSALKSFHSHLRIFGIKDRSDSAN